jgi:hypothetical protein
MKLSEYLKDKVYFIIVNLICISIIILLLLRYLFLTDFLGTDFFADLVDEFL